MGTAHLRRQLAQAWPRWQAKKSALAFSSVDELEEHLRSPSVSATDYDAVLGALLRLGRHEPLAMRVVLHLYLPCLKGMVGPHPPLENSEWVGLLVATAFEQIRHYPVNRRPRDIAPNLAWAIRKGAYSTLRRQRHDRAELSDDPAVVFAAAEHQSGRGRTEVVDLAEVIRWAVEHGVLTRSTARLIELTRIEGREVVAVADRFCASLATLRQRRWGAERRLRCSPPDGGRLMPDRTLHQTDTWASTDTVEARLVATVMGRAEARRVVVQYLPGRVTDVLDVLDRLQPGTVHDPARWTLDVLRQGRDAVGHGRIRHRTDVLTASTSAVRDQATSHRKPAPG